MLQVLVLFLCATIFGCFVYELAAVKPVWLDVAKGFIPTPEILTNNSMLYTAIGIVGKTADTWRTQHLVQLHSSCTACSVDCLAQERADGGW